MFTFAPAKRRHADSEQLWGSGSVAGHALECNHWATSSSLSENRRSECEVAGVQKEEDLATAHFSFAQQLCGNGRTAVAR